MPTDAAGRMRLAVRIALLLVLAATAFFALRNAAGLALAGSRAGIRVDPGNAIVLSRAALEIAQTDAKGAEHALVRDYATRAIARDPTSATALTALGLVSPPPRDGRLIRTSQGLSRRSLYAQLWLIEDAVRREQVPEALQHYDIALRTSRQAPGLLFGVLVAAADDPTLLQPLAARLSLRPVWGPLYLQQLAQSGKDLNNIAWLLATLRARRVDVGDPALAAIWPRLTTANAFEAAWRIYAAGNPQARRVAVRSLTPAGSPSPFDWNPGAPEAASTQVVDGGLAFSPVADGGGVAARQMLMLPPGRHVIDFSVRDYAVDSGTPAFIRVSCARTDAEFARIALPVGTARRSLAFTVPAACGAQWLTLNVPPDELPNGTGGTVEGFSVR